MPTMLASADYAGLPDPLYCQETASDYADDARFAKSSSTQKQEAMMLACPTPPTKLAMQVSSTQIQEAMMRMMPACQTPSP